MKTYIRPQTIKLHMLTERGFLYNSPSRDVGAKKNFSDFESSDDGDSQWSKQKSLWDD